MSTDESTALTTTTRPNDRHDGWTPERQVAFLRALTASHSVSAAAREVGLSRQSAYALRARLKGEPFDLAWTAALRCRFDALAEAAMERALNGVEVPHFFQGELVHTSRRYDERLTVALLAMRESFRGPRVGLNHRASAYDPDDFGRLLARIEEGPETWNEQVRLEYEELYAEEEEGEEYCPHCGSDEECACDGGGDGGGDLGDGWGDDAEDAEG